MSSGLNVRFMSVERPRHIALALSSMEKSLRLTGTSPRVPVEKGFLKYLRISLLSRPKTKRRMRMYMSTEGRGSQRPL